MPSGNFAKVSFVGANTVNGSSLLRVYISPAALTAATSVEKSSLATATPTISGVISSTTVISAV